MPFVTETGYVLPGGDEPLKNARFLHKGNRQRMKAISASAELAQYPAIAVDNGMTFEGWRPFANTLVDASDFNSSVWSSTRMTVNSDGQTLDEGTDVATTRFMEQTMEFTAEEWVLSATVQRQTLEAIRVQGRADGVTYSAVYDLRDGSVITMSAGVSADVVAVGDDEFLLRLYFTPAADVAGTFRIFGYDLVADSITYTGSNRTVRVLRSTANPSVATISLEAFGAVEADMIAVGGHNIGTAAGRFTFRHDSNADDTYTDIDTFTPTDDSPIMFLFVGITSARWQIQIDRAVLPELSIIRVGQALQMPLPIHQGHRPFETNRITQMRGNLSEGGEWLGRSIIRRYLDGSFRFPNLTPTFVRNNLDGQNGLIQAMEVEPFFVAWRPDTYDEAYYAWTAGAVNGPIHDQSPNLMSFAFKCQAYGYE